MTDSTDIEIEILERIRNDHSHVRQRDLARVLGLSLGMTNSIIKRLAQKGWLTIRKVNNRNIRYAVSAAGAEEIARRSYRYLKRTIKNVVDYKVAIGRLVDVARENGYSRLVLVGSSDLDFVVEHVCMSHGLDYRTAEAWEEQGDHVFCLYSERSRPKKGEETAAAKGTAYLRNILV